MALTLSTLAIVMLPSAAGASSLRAGTPWPGGTWNPDPPRYGMVVVSHVPVHMSDGATLFASIGYPSDPTTGKRASGTFPVLLAQNPYAGGTAPDPFFVKRGYIFVAVEVRGTQDTEGPGGQEVADELWSKRDAEDGVQLVQWVAHKLPGSNGVVGLSGCSYLGINEIFTAAAVGKDSPVKAMIPACTSNSYNTYFIGGIPSQTGWLLGDIGGVGSILGTRNAAANAAFGKSLGEEIQAGRGRAYNDAWWQSRTTANYAAAIVNNGIPALLWSGWSATEMPGPLELYAEFQNAWAKRPVFGPMSLHQPVTGRYQVIVGSGSHAEGIDDSIELEWYDTWLKGQRTAMAETKTPMHLYEQGSARWTNASTYPLTDSYTPFFLTPQGALRTTPTQDALEGRTLKWGPPTQSGTTLTYTSNPLPRDATIAGPIAVSVYASSSNRNLELIATLNDVSPTGSVKQVSTGALLGSLRAISPAKTWYDTHGLIINPYHPYLEDHYVSAGTEERYDIKLYPTLWSIPAGDSLQLVLSTEEASTDCGITLSSLPVPLPCHLTASQLRTVPGGIYRIDSSKSAPSSVNVPLLPGDALSTARSAVTATSHAQSEPLSWGAK